MNVLFENEYLFGNIILEWIPHPKGLVGDFFRYASMLCHFLGGISFFIFLVPFIYLCYDRILGIKIAVAILSTSLLNGFAKFYFESVRPFGLSESILETQTNYISETSYGFPSGHSHVSILVWGILFLYFKNLPIKCLAIFLLIFTPFSRMYSGMHFPGDVLGGFFMGLISLILIEYFFKKYPNFIKLEIQDENRKKIFRTLSLLIIVFTLPSILLSSNGSIQSKSSLSQVIISTGSISGFFIGYLFLEIFFQKFNSFEKSILWKDFFKRAFILLIGILVFYFGLSVMEKNLKLEENIFRYCRYFILNFYIAGLSPILYYKWR